MILTGVAGNICVLFTANDAYMRDFHLVVPADCVASNTEDENRHAIEQMRKVLKADVRPSTEIDLDALKRGRPGPPIPRERPGKVRGLLTGSDRPRRGRPRRRSNGVFPPGSRPGS